MITLNGLGALVGILGFVSAVVLALARTVWLTAQMKAEFEALKTSVLQHVSDSSLHRNPDSEARWNRQQAALDQIQLDITNIKVALNIKNGGPHA